MAYPFYQFQLGLLTVICVVLIALERYLKSKKSPPDHSKDIVTEENIEDGHPLLESNGAAVSTSSSSRAGALNALMRKYLLVYAVVMGLYRFGLMTFPEMLISLKGADWLQGPYVYSLYREQYEYPERLVAVLFVTGFLSAAVFAPLVGVWADT